MIVDGLERHVRVDHAGAVAEQQRHVVHLARVARFDHQRARGARALAHQVMVHAGRGQQARDRRQIARSRRGPTGSGCRSRPSPPRWPCGTARPSPCSSPAPPVRRVEQHRQRRGAERQLRRQVAQLGHVLVVDDRVLDVDLPARLAAPARAGCAPGRWSSPSTSPAPRGSRRAAGWSPARRAA